ncbi:hypothetical protein KFL_003540120 [Klebsormidium nitens]|uniref:MYND-type domain-containing protein n=1 Tax=Klebsormidium nitens TaxID=105231 RepID=A0A1Y1IDE3_KLENI|nr:hypothetical protein KFL_003540120 [Klebsormidium nitens]|eukprot:GAQ87459.1 hypothetical protein KFL_003540120 [Klebsormidium nitens]
MAAPGQLEDDRSSGLVMLTMREVEEALAFCATLSDESPSSDVSGSKRERLRRLSTSDAFTIHMQVASVAKAQDFVKKGVFKILCQNLRSLEDEKATLNTLANMVNLMERVPELVAKGWEFGAVKPIAGIVKDADKQGLFGRAGIQSQTEKQNRALLGAQLLRGALCFLSVMGKPLQSHRPGDPPYRATVKTYKWLAKEGFVLLAAKAWLALSALGPHLSNPMEQKIFDSLSFNASAIVHAAVSLELQNEDLVTMPGLLDAVCPYLLGETSAMSEDLSSAHFNALSVLGTLWLEDRSDSPQAALYRNARKKLARHNDALNVALALQKLVEHGAPNLHAGVGHLQMCFIELAYLLSVEHSGDVPAPVLETACHLMGTAIDERLYERARSAIAHAYHAGRLSVDQLFAHLFPEFLDAVKCKIVQAAPATVMVEELYWLANMLDFLVLAFRYAVPTVSRDGRFVPPSDAEEATELPMNELPRLVTLIVAKKVPALLTQLFRSVFVRRVYDLCSVLAMSAIGQREELRRSLAEALVGPLSVAKFEKLQEDDPGAVEKRERVLKLLTEDIRTDRKILKYGGIQTRTGTSSVKIVYDWGSNKFEVVESFARQIKTSLAGRSLDAEHHRHVEAIMEDLQKLSVSTRTAHATQDSASDAPEKACAKCRTRTSFAKRCSGCKVVYYCGVDCQRKDWPKHRTDCKSRAS